MTDAASIEHPTGLTAGDFTAADEPLRLFAAWFAEAERAEPVNPERHDAGDRRWRRTAQCAHGPVEGLRRARLRLLHEPRQREGPGIEHIAEGGADVLLEDAAAPGPAARKCRAGLGGGGGQLFRHALAHGADRRLGQQPIGAARKPHGVREGGRALYREIRDRRGAAAAALVGLPHRPAGDRVLAGAAVPAARPHRLHAVRARPHRGARRGSIRKHHDIGARSKAIRRTDPQFASDS